MRHCKFILRYTSVHYPAIVRTVKIYIQGVSASTLVNITTIFFISLSQYNPLPFTYTYTYIYSLFLLCYQASSNDWLIQRYKSPMHVALPSFVIMHVTALVEFSTRIQIFFYVKNIYTHTCVYIWACTVAINDQIFINKHKSSETTKFYVRDVR